MKIKTLKNVGIAGEHVEAGSVVEVSDAVGRELILMKKAEAVSAKNKAAPPLRKRRRPAKAQPVVENNLKGAGGFVCPFFESGAMQCRYGLKNGV